MAEYNLISAKPIDITYSIGWLPQRNKKGWFYKDSSCRSDLSKFSLSSENRRILRKTDEYNYELLAIEKFNFSSRESRLIYKWIKQLSWDFPSSSVKTIFTNHIFNQIYIWKKGTEVIGYGLMYCDNTISHIAYVFYNPEYLRSNLPIRMVLQAVIDSHEKGLKYCYLGRFSKDNGFYKRTMPGFEYFNYGKWQEYV